MVTGYKWELYKLNDDYSQANDLAATNPTKLKELQKLFDLEAAKYNVYPLDNRAFVRMLTARPSATAGQSEFTYSGEISGISPGTAPPFMGRSFTIRADIVVPEGGAEGMLATQGGEPNGYGLYLLKGKPVFTYNLLDYGTHPVGGATAARPRQAHRRFRLHLRPGNRQGRHGGPQG